VHPFASLHDFLQKVVEAHLPQNLVALLSVFLNIYKHWRRPTQIRWALATESSDFFELCICKRMLTLKIVA